MITVNEAIEVLQSIQKNGNGKWPLQLMVVVHGVTFAEDVQIIEAQEYDGEKAWIYSTGIRHSPKWMHDGSVSNRLLEAI